MEKLIKEGYTHLQAQRFKQAIASFAVVLEATPSDEKVKNYIPVDNHK